MSEEFKECKNCGCLHIESDSEPQDCRYDCRYCIDETQILISARKGVIWMTKNKLNSPLEALNRMKNLVIKQTSEPDKPILGYLEIMGVPHPITDEKDWAIIEGKNDQKQT